ncbi:MAG: GNAT family N-acetyltransferase [Chloroflexota bacterium]|nr:GNAT family N-acetyltransferase [Chloroflexota bacterium]
MRPRGWGKPTPRAGSPSSRWPRLATRITSLRWPNWRDASSPTVAEIALVVADAHQRAGIGSALCAYLVAAARRQGLAALRAMALAENVAVRRMVARSGATYTTETRQGMTTIQIDLRNVGSLGAAARA